MAPFSGSFSVLSYLLQLVQLPYHTNYAMATTTTTTTPAALTSIDDDSIIKNRLLTRTTVTRGEPPLKKLKRKFNNFCSEVKKGSSNDVEAAAKTFLHEFNSYILPLSKAKAIIDAQLREEECFKKLQEELTSQISQVRTDLAYFLCKLKIESLTSYYFVCARWKLS